MSRIRSRGVEVFAFRLFVLMVINLPTPIVPFAGVVVTGGGPMVHSVAGIVFNDRVNEFVGDMLCEVNLDLSASEEITSLWLHSLADSPGGGW